MDPFKFPDKCFGVSLELGDKFTEIFPSAFINKTEQHNIDNILNHKQSINLYYKNKCHNNHNIDEHIKKRYPKNVLTTDATKKIRLIIYYNKCKTSSLIISNNSSPSIELLDKTNIVYIFKCPKRHCLQ